MENFPAESRALISVPLGAVIKCHLGSTTRSKDAGTIRGRRLHFIWFAHQLRLLPSLLPVVKLSTEALNYIMAMFAAHLGSGNTLLHQTIRSKTVSTYCQHVANFLTLFDEHERDPRKLDKSSPTFAPVFKKVINELARYEDITTLKEPYTVAMQHRLVALCKTISNRDGIYCVLRDWFQVMLHAGGRRGEWAQPMGKYDLERPELDEKGITRAFLIGDIQMMLVGKRCITHATAIADHSLAQFTQLTWRTQKNGDHGEKKAFAASNRDPELSTPRAWARILERFLRFFPDQTPTEKQIPLGVFWDDIKNAPRLITSNEIQIVMRAIAMIEYNLDPIKDKDKLAKWVAHSLRVGGCVLLQALGFHSDDIQKLLRWHSDAWKDYTRDLAVVAQRHSNAIVDAGQLPCF